MYYELSNQQRAALYCAKVARRRQRKQDRIDRFVDKLFLFAVGLFLWVVSVALVLTWW